MKYLFLLELLLILIALYQFNKRLNNHLKLIKMQDEKINLLYDRIKLIVVWIGMNKEENQEEVAKKYQKIQEILDDCDLEAWEVLEKIKEVVEDGQNTIKD